MGYPGYPPPYPYPYPPPPPHRSGADVAISIVALVLTVVIGGIASLMSLSGLAFLDRCPPSTCSPEGAVTAVMTAILMAALVGLIGMILTIVRLASRKPAWPFAVCTLAAVVGVFVLGAIGYGAAVS
jgi:hypothetical protein